MSWRELLGAGDPKPKPQDQYSHNPQKYPRPVNCGDIGNIGDRKSDSDSALQAFVDLVRITAACEHHILLHRADIRAGLDADDRAELLTTTREERQSWAAAISSRLARARICTGWEGAA